MAVTMKAWFRALAAGLKSEATAQAVAGLSVLVFVLYTGYASESVLIIIVWGGADETFALFSSATIHDWRSSLDLLH